MRFWAALLAGKIVIFFCRLFRYPGTSLPGAVALKICPQLLTLLAPAYEQVVAVTGTNGKTTTANLIAHTLRSSGLSAANNFEGANMISGVASALIRDCTIYGKARSQVAVFEVDEGSVGKVFPAVKPDLVVVTNYFRDQLDRYCELNHNITLLHRVLAELPKTSLLLNADDPLVVVAVAGRDQSAVSCYGIEGKQSEDETSDRNIREGKFCPNCGKPLSYHYYHYGQLGDYYCTECSFKRPAPQFLAYDVKDDHYLEFTLDVRSKDFSEGCSAVKTLSLRAPMRGFYNIYNILAASAAAITLGVSHRVIKESLMEYIPATGRMERFLCKGRPCTLALIKNPAGLNEVLKTLLRTEGEKALVIAINDLAADGRDVSWLWDAGLEMLSDQSIKKVICAGRRAGDIAVRLKYAGVPPVKLVLEPECSKSLEFLGLQGAEECFVLTSYTNLSRYAKLLEKMGKDVVRGAG